MTTERQLIKSYYSDEDTTKSISDIVNDLKTKESNNNMNYTTEQIQDRLKSDFPNISDWSF
tara:strand:- start:529 stop:711 length:183 start_codon:yes stop_codon:yes gene_type:complete